jgi:hypothetical protein
MLAIAKQMLTAKEELGKHNADVDDDSDKRG